MKNFLSNKDNIVILIVSLVALIIGCLAINPIISIIIVMIADILFFLPDILKVKDSIVSKNPKKVSNNKTRKVKKDNNEKKTLKKKILMVLLFFVIAFISLMIIFALYIVISAPKFDPNELYAQEPSILYDNKGEEIGKIGAEKRKNITYDDLPEVLVDAIVATEDSKFFQHNGFDLSRFLVASIKQVFTSGGGGASTLTMQVVKNTFTSTTSSGFEGIKRKFTDIYMSVFQVEKKYTKKEILEFYVNSYYLGSGAYGVEQASKTYFGKSAKDLSLNEAAVIAGLFQAPNAYDPYKHPEKAEARRNQVLALMKRHGYITDEEYKAAKSIKVEDMLVKSDGTDSSSNGEWQGFIDLVVADIVENTKYDPYTTSMKIYTTMDREKQSWINDVMSGKTYTWQNDVVDAGITVEDVNTGAIVAIGAGRHRVGERQYNNATQINKQIGSTAKPLYDYAPGIEYENWSTYTLFDDSAYSYSDGTAINDWDRKYNGLMTMRTALAQSRNIPALKAFQNNKNSNILKFVKSVGLHPEESNGVIHEAHSIGGYTGESPRDMAAAYASFGNGGYYIKPYSYTKLVINATNEEIETEVNKTRVMSEETAYMMTSLLQSAAQQGLGNQYNIGGAVYGAKTGTTNYDAKVQAKFGDNAVNDLWVDGVSPDYSISVWYGYKDLNRTYTSTAFTIAHRTLFQAVAKGIFKNGSNWSKPSGVSEVAVEFGTWPAKLPSEYTPSDRIVTELFKSGTEPTEVSDRYSKLENVTNLTSNISDNKLTLKWNAIKTPNAISSGSMNGIYGGYSGNSAGENQSILGSIIYKIYAKDSSGNLSLVTETSGTSATFDITTSSPTTYVVKTSYTNSTANMSDGVSTNISLSNVKANIQVSLNVKDNLEIAQNSSYTLSSSDVKVTADSKDVTNKASISITVDNKTTTSIDTTTLGTHVINYKITYDGKTYNLSRTVKVVDSIKKVNG